MKTSETKNLIYGILLVLAIGIGASYCYKFVYNPTATPNISARTVEKKEGLFTLVASNSGNSNWAYTVTAQLPTPCDKAVVDALVTESYPEQVTIRVKTSTTGEFCTQVIQDFKYTGSFTASKDANIALSVTK